MTIKNVRANHYSIPLPVVLSDSMHGDMPSFELMTVRVTDSTGNEGLGYTYTLSGGARAIHSVIVNDIAPVLIGREADRIEDIWKHLWWSLHYSGRGGLAMHALSAVDIALWDLMGKRTGLPLWRLLGGADRKVKAYAGGIDLMFTLDELLAQTDGNLAKGFRAIKMKVGRDNLREDVERIAAMRDHLGRDFPLMVDANMRWTVDEAIRAARAFRDLDLVWLEEPTIPEDFSGHARILTEGGVPISSGENLHTLYDFQHMLAANGVSYIEPDVSNCGGVTVWMKVARLAEARNMPVTSHGVHDIHVHLLGAIPNASYLEVHGFGLERYIAEPLEIVEGYATAGDKPGHGISFDWAGLETHRV
jgi:L-alanine-DL-glutamate epimerase-like enolase superfamily enzyme